MTIIKLKIESDDLDDAEIVLDCYDGKYCEESFTIYSNSDGFNFYFNDFHSHEFNGCYKFVRVFFRNFFALNKNIKPFLK